MQVEQDFITYRHEMASTLCDHPIEECGTVGVRRCVVDVVVHLILIISSPQFIYHRRNIVRLN